MMEKNFARTRELLSKPIVRGEAIAYDEPRNDGQNSLEGLMRKVRVLAMFRITTKGGNAICR